MTLASILRATRRRQRTIWMIAGLGLLLAIRLPLPAAETKPTRHIEGTVTDQTGKPIADALVEWGYIHDPPDKWQHTTTDANGHYRLDVVEFGVDFRLGVSATNWAPQWLVPHASWYSRLGDSNDEAAPPPPTADFKLESQHHLTGIIVNAQGQPVSGARVQAQTASTGFFSSFSSPTPSMPIPGRGKSEMITGPNGRFTLVGLPAEEVQLSVNSPHRYANDGNYSVDQETRIVMSGSGRPGTVHAKVYDRDTEKPVSDFIVVRRHNPESRSFNSYNGRFQWPTELTEGDRYTFYIYSKDYAPGQLDTTASPLKSDQEATVGLSPGHPLLGQLVDAKSGQPLAQVPVLYAILDDRSRNEFEWPDRNKYADGYYDLTTVQRAVTDDQGNFWFSEAKNRQNGTLFILNPGYERLILMPDHRPAADTTDRIRIKLPPEASISGRILQDGKPVANAEISLSKENSNSTFNERFEVATTDAIGSYRLGSLSPGQYRVSYITHPSRSVNIYKPIGTVTLAPEEQAFLAPDLVDMKFLNPPKK